MSTAHLVARALFRDLASRLFSIRRGTWIAIALILLAIATFAVWSIVTFAGWVFGVARDGVASVPEATRGVIEQVGKNIPGADQALETLRSIGQPPPRDVSGTDPAPVARYPGLARSHWHRDGQEITVRYEGRAAFGKVLDHYVTGFTAAGYRQNMLSASPDEERHEYLKDGDRIALTIARKAPDQVKVSLVTRLT